MLDIAIYDEELGELARQARILISALDSFTEHNKRLEKFNKAQDLMRRLQKTHHQFKVEVRMLETHEKEIYEKRGQAHLQTINQLKEELQSKKVESVVSTEAHENTPWSTMDAGKDEARVAARRISAIQSSTLNSLAVTERLLNETETVGIDAAAKLQSQTEQIRQVNDNVDELDSEVNRAKKELNAFIRRMMTDKIIICFSVLILIGIIVIVALKIVKDK